jgi:hypothetical protein
MVSLLPMRRRLCRHRDGVVALVAMALLPLPICRRLAVVDDDGDGVGRQHRQQLRQCNERQQ